MLKFTKKVLCIGAGIFLTHSVFAQDWQLVWQDEFTNGISSDWVFETGNGSSGWGNNELQYYLQDNATVEDGQLVITAKQESVNGYSYTSARMKTQGIKSFTYGKIEARIALPAKQGLWPAFWMLGSDISSVGWPACGEIDIMEQVNTESTVYGTVHWQDNTGSYASYGGNTGADVTGYHVYAIEWNESTITWYVDGVQYHIIDITDGVNGTDEFHNDFFILLNMAVGGNWPGFTIDTGSLPAKMYVDYVRVYQDGGSSSNDFSYYVEAENYSSMSGVEVEDCSDTGGGSNVGYIETGDWMAYSDITIPTSGYYTLQYRVASQDGGGSLSQDLNAGSIVLGSVSIPSTGDWQSWTTVSQTVYIDAGTYSFGIYAATGGWNINWWQIIGQSGATVARSSKNLVEESVTDAAASIKLYPNPASDVLNIELPLEMSGDVVVYNGNGQTVLKTTLSATSQSIDISGLESGVYAVQIGAGDNLVTKRFIKK